MIRLEGMIKSFGDSRVLRGIDLEIEKGEVVSTAGPNGTGRTTSLRIMGALDMFDKGSVMTDDTLVNHLKEKKFSAFRNKHVGFIFQLYQLLPEFTALENVMTPAFIVGMGQQGAKTTTNEILEFMGLMGHASHEPNELSSGEEQRVAVARALIDHPAVVLADESPEGLDTYSKEELHQLFFDLCNRLGQTFVIVTHNEGLAQITDHIIHLKDNEVCNYWFLFKANIVGEPL